MNGTTRMRGEGRRLLHPGTGVAIATVALLAVYLQAGRSPYASDPSPADAIGALRIGLLQHATLLGAALASFFAGMTIGEDLDAGTFETWRLSDPRWLRRWLRRTAVLAGALLVSALVTAIALRATASGASGGPSTMRDLAIDGLPACGVIVTFAAVSLATSLAVRNPLLLVTLTVTVLTLPSYTIGRPFNRIVPAGLVARALHLTENGTGVNYLGEKSGHLERSPSQWIALSVLACVSIAAVGAGAVFAERKGRRQGG